MSGCKGLHCPGCGDGGGAGIIALVVLVVIGATVHAVWHTIVEVAEIAAWTVVGLAGLAAAAGIAWGVRRILQEAPRRPVSPGPVSQIPPGTRPRLEGSHNQAIEPPRELHLHLHGLAPGQLAAIVTQRGARLEEDRPA